MSRSRFHIALAFEAVLALTGGLDVEAQHAGMHAPPAGAEQDLRVPLYDDLGDHAYPITTAVPAAQSYFDQGLRLYYAFNHQEAIRSFREAQRLDAGCAMCWWGEALAWGPNINLPMDEAAGAAAWTALEQARERVATENERERDLIRALATRYSPDPAAERAPLDRAYAAAMGALAKRYPQDEEVIVLHGEAVMTQMPWDYWAEDGSPRPGIQEALTGLERVVAGNERHPGACHFYIHAVEKLFPERAVECAERLRGLMPGAGHLVHMPGHIYIRVGRYEDAIRVNEHAVHADETYIRDQRPETGMYTAGYYPHNYDFLAFAAAMIGRSAQGIDAARRMASVIPPEMLGEPGFTFVQHYAMRPLQLLVRFGRWDDVLAFDEPPATLPHARAMWHYAVGRARLGTGDVEGARVALRALRQAARSPELAEARLEFNAVRDILRIAEAVLSGRIAAAEGRFEAAIAELTEGVRRDDALLYGEPPEWTVPVRHDLGAVLLEAGRAAEAEAVYREDLRRFPGNGWSLFGLGRALRAQGRHAEAAPVEREFDEVWRGSDVRIESSAY